MGEKRTWNRGGKKMSLFSGAIFSLRMGKEVLCHRHGCIGQGNGCRDLAEQPWKQGEAWFTRTAMPPHARWMMLAPMVQPGMRASLNLSSSPQGIFGEPGQQLTPGGPFYRGSFPKGYSGVKGLGSSPLCSQTCSKPHWNPLCFDHHGTKAIDPSISSTTLPPISSTPPYPLSWHPRMLCSPSLAGCWCGEGRGQKGKGNHILSVKLSHMLHNS